MCFLSLGSGCFLKFLSSNPGQDICIPVWFLHIDGSYPVNEAIWDGEERGECGQNPWYILPSRPFNKILDC